MQLKWQIGDRAFIIPSLIVQCVALLLVGFLSLTQGLKYHNQDLGVYYNSSLHLLQGQVPYRGFRLEYPPLALLPFVLPHLIKLGHLLSFARYKWLFMLENVMLSILVALLLVQVMSRWQPQSRRKKVLWFYVLLAVIIGQMLLMRYDIFPALLTQAALLCVLFGRPNLAGLWLGFGIVAKLYPVVLLPIFSTYYLVKKDYRALCGFLLVSISTTCLTLLPFALTARGELLSFLNYHEMRGLQIETLPAGIILLMNALGLTKAKWVFNYGAFHLDSPLADAVLKCLPFVFILAFVGLIVSCLVCFRDERVKKGAISDESLVAYTIAALLTFMVAGKVFSPQYAIWLLPFAPLLRPKQAIAMIAIFILTIAIYPFAYDSLLAMHTWPVLLLNLRNFLMVIVLLWIIVERLPVFTSAAIHQRSPRRSLIR